MVWPSVVALPNDPDHLEVDDQEPERLPGQERAQEAGEPGGAGGGPRSRSRETR